ncbi:MAG: site-specific DNA-methyltransferase [Ruminococcus sp.]|nr:site-specific DNA-methyltransferase [Ruminococcus sp.]
MELNKMDGMSMNIEQTEMEKLKSVFPQCFAEGKLDIDKLLGLCGEYIDNDFEKYKFEWKGKMESLKLAQKRSTGTLRPCKAESVNFDETQNLYIEGDNLEVLKLLQTAYYNKIKMIYIDPPYNTGNDFVYEDDFADPMARYKEVTQQTTKSNAETMGRFHTNWLSMMYPRLRLAYNLLRQDGAIFISIDDNEVTNLRKLCDEIFGEENFLACIVWQKKYAATNDSKGFSTTHDYIVVYQKTDSFKRNLLPRTAEQNKPYKNDDGDGKGLWRSDNLLVKSFSQSGVYPIVNPNTGKEYYPPEGSCWRASKETMSVWLAENRIFFGKDGLGAPQLKRYLNEVQQGRVPITWWPFEEVGHNDAANKEVQALFGKKAPFDTPKPVALIKQMLLIATDTNSEDIVMDFFAGSSTTAHAVMQLNAEDGGNRKYICVQIPEMCDEKSEAFKTGYKTICEVGIDRIKLAGKKILEENEQTEIGGEDKKPLDIGFKVFKLDDSNLKSWDSAPIEDAQIDIFYERLNSMIDTVKHDRTDMDVVYEVMLKMGIPLDVEVQYMEINGKIVYIVGDFLLMICLGKDITAEDIEGMAQYAPAKIICAEAGFADDSALSNAHYILKDRAIELKLV